MDIQRAHPRHLADARLLLDEYFSALEVVQRDTPADIAAALADPHQALWLAYVAGAPAGCVALRPLLPPPPGVAGALECKRLFVRPALRGRGVAQALLDTLENHARQSGAAWIYLDSKDDLRAALALYAQRGWQACERYNDNPQATVFLRKPLA